MFFRPLLSFLAALLLLAGQSRAKDGFLIRAWQTDDGLPRSIIQTLDVSGKGCLWIGTIHEMARFDGLRFATFNLETVTGHSSDADGTFRLVGGGEEATWIIAPSGTLLEWTIAGWHVAADAKDGIKGVMRVFTGPGGQSLAFENSGRMWRVDGPKPQLAGEPLPVKLIAMERDGS